ncbi:hypothetical protein [Halomonas koreensis]|uniref:Uncharacterized protein n=1 Tax=Halomonas koreensis TaxID=245385 RepID=A0ABU1G5Z8_9GAMM|nr:hypothetical protein [Halomonas koreensis]MDR5867912.1 hypothetical protein [Halomonas koreensis]
MRGWLKKTTGCLIIAVGLASSGTQLATSFTSPVDIGRAIEQCDIKIGDLPCFVEYEPIDNGAAGGDLDYSQFIVAIFFDISRDGVRWTDNQDRLLKAVDDDWLLVSTDEEPGYRIGRLLVKAPHDPRETLAIANRMADNGSVTVSWPNGEDYLEFGRNTDWGNFSTRPI